MHHAERIHPEGPFDPGDTMPQEIARLNDSSIIEKNLDQADLAEGSFSGPLDRVNTRYIDHFGMYGSTVATKLIGGRFQARLLQVPQDDMASLLADSPLSVQSPHPHCRASDQNCLVRDFGHYSHPITMCFLDRTTFLPELNNRSRQAESAAVRDHFRKTGPIALFPIS